MFPVARFVILCQEAVREPNYTWTVRDPRYAVRMPVGVKKKFKLRALYIYAQISAVTGPVRFEFDLYYLQPGTAESELVRLNPPEEMTFDQSVEDTDRARVYDLGVKLSGVPFARPGQYEIRVSANGRVLENGIACLDVAEGRTP